MQMTNGEIRTSYKQALHKTEQVKILAQLNAVSTDEIIDILCETGEFSRSQFNRIIFKLSGKAEKPRKPKTAKATTEPAEVPEPEKEITVKQAVKRIKAEYDKLTAEIEAKTAERDKFVRLVVGMMTGDGSD